jgi:hypothetical protein
MFSLLTRCFTLLSIIIFLTGLASCVNLPAEEPIIDTDKDNIVDAEDNWRPRS